MAKSDNCCHSTEARHWIRYLLNSLSDWDVIKALASLRQLSGTLSLFIVDVVGDISRMSKKPEFGRNERGSTSGFAKTSFL